jgi:hypothetical protein
MNTLLLILLATVLSVQDDVADRVRLSKIKDIEKAKSNIKRVAPPFINFETCGDYLIIASQSSPNDPMMAYCEGNEIKEGEVVRYYAFRRLVVEIDDSLKAPEIRVPSAEGTRLADVFAVLSG